MKLHIVTHCYAGLLPQYAALLHYQLSSLSLWKAEDCDVSVTVVGTVEDELTLRVYNNWRADHCPASVQSTFFQQSKAALFNRAIGRNVQALTTKADLVWFADCDYVFGEGCFDRLAVIWNAVTKNENRPTLMYPRTVRIHKSHELGDAAIVRQLRRLHSWQYEPTDVDPAEFKCREESKPYGGLFIVNGDYCREHGWLRRHSSVLREVEDTSVPFQSFRDDVMFRKQCGGWVNVQLPNVYRIRHSKTTYQGKEGLTGELERKC